MSTIKILVADDHPIIRQGIRLLLSAESDLEIVAECKDGQSAVELAARTKPDVVLMDVAMPLLNGALATQRILKQRPNCRVVALTTYTDDEAIKRMLQAGVVGYLTKQSAADELIDAIRQVSSGMTCFSRSVVPTVQRLRHTTGGTVANGELSPREKLVVKLIAEGLTNKQIASQLQLNLSQLKYCRERVMDRLKLHNIADLTRYALAKGWITLEKQKNPLTVAAPTSRPDLKCSLAPVPATQADKAPPAEARDCLAA